MKYVCKNCEEEFKVSFLEYINRLFSKDYYSLCDRCIELKKWKYKSKFMSYGRLCVNIDIDIGEFEDPSNILCSVIENNLKIERINMYNEQRYKVIQVKLRDENEKVRIWPTEIKNDYLIGYNVEYDPNIKYGIFRKGREFKKVPINLISYIKIEDDIEKYDAPEIDKPMIGYKGLTLDNGILFANNKYIYDIKIPFIEEKKNPYKNDFQDIYSHFCESIEDVLDWRNFISTPDYRLFKVKAEGHCFRYRDHWVANKLTVISEVTQDEIIDYFKSNVERLKIIGSKLESDWNDYQKEKIKPYKFIIDNDEIIEEYKSSCKAYKSEICKQSGSSFNEGLCDICLFSRTPCACDKGNLYYLQLRAEIMNNTFKESDNRFKWLIAQGKNQNNKVKALKRIIKYYT